MRLGEIYGFILTFAIYFLIIKEYRFKRKVKRRTEDVQTKKL